MASYGGGGAGGPIGNSKLAMSSKESAAAVDKFKNDFVGVNNNTGELAEGEAEPDVQGEVQAGSEIGAREGASLFERAHAAHERSIQKGKIRF